VEPVKSVLDHYLMIQTELAKDSVKGLDEHANAIAKSVKADDTKNAFARGSKSKPRRWPKSKDLKSAREAFKPLSTSLIKYLADNKQQRHVSRGVLPHGQGQLVANPKEHHQSLYGQGMLTAGNLRTERNI